MSTCAVFFVLFNEQPSPDRIKSIEALIANRTDPTRIISANDHSESGHLTPVEDADLLTDINDDGSLNYLHKERYAPLIGVASTQGRLLKLGPLARLWSESYPYGPAVDYVTTALVLLAQDDIIGLWYGNEQYQDGVTIPPMTKEAALQMLDEFIRIGIRDN